MPGKKSLDATARKKRAGACCPPANDIAGWSAGAEAVSRTYTNFPWLIYGWGPYQSGGPGQLGTQ